MAVVQLIPLGNYSRVNFILEEMGTLGMKRRKWEPSVHLLPLTALTVSLLRAPPTSGLTQAPHTEPLPLKVKRNCHSKASRCAVRGEIERKLCLLSEWGFEPDPDTHTALWLCKHCNWRAEDSILLECRFAVTAFSKLETGALVCERLEKERKAKGKAATS